MPAPDSQEVRRDGRLPTGLFWTGVGLAPLAALLLLLGPEGAPLRLAAVLAVVVVVLIGLSITLRSNSDALRTELEDVLYEEVDALRADVRQDIGTAARATHRAFGEKFQILSQQVQGLRAQVEAARPDTGTGYQRAVTASPPPMGAIGAGPVTGAIGAGRAAPSGGVVRHTETVQVTTRQTIVDPPRDEAPRGGTVYGGGYGRRDEADDAGWSERRPAADDWRARSYEDRSYEEEPGYDDRRSGGARGGDRWSPARDDDRGVQLRMGERRAAVHSDASGTDLHIEDRWATVRRDEPRREETRYDSRQEPVRYDEPRREETRHEPDRDASYDGQWREDPYGRRSGGYEDQPAAEYGSGDRWRDGSGEDRWRGDQDAGRWREEAGDARWSGDAGGGRWSDDRDGWRDDAAVSPGRHGQNAGGGEDWRGDPGGGRHGENPDGWNGGDGGSGNWAGDAAVRWGDGQWSGGDGAPDDGRRAEAGWGREHPALPALPAGGRQQGVWDGEWAEPERQPVSTGRRHRDDEPNYRYLPEPDDRWR